MFYTRVRTAIAAALAASLAAGAALAHHGFGGEYDRSTPIYLEGVVEQAFFGYPHAEIVLTADASVDNAPGVVAEGEFGDGLTFWRAELGPSVEIEFPPVRRFFDLDGRIAPGDRIGVVVLRNCEPPHQLRGQWVAPAEGDPVVRSGRMQNEVSGC